MPQCGATSLYHSPVLIYKAQQTLIWKEYSIHPLERSYLSLDPGEWGPFGCHLVNTISNWHASSTSATHLNFGLSFMTFHRSVAWFDVMMRAGMAVTVFCLNGSGHCQVMSHLLTWLQHRSRCKLLKQGESTRPDTTYAKLNMKRSSETGVFGS